MLLLGHTYRLFKLFMITFFNLWCHLLKWNHSWSVCYDGFLISFLLSKSILKQMKQANPLTLTYTLMQRCLIHHPHSWLCTWFVGFSAFQLSLVLFSQCQSATNGSVGGSLHFSAFFSLFQMVVFQCSLEWSPQHKISTCKLNEDSYIGSIFNYFNHCAASNIHKPQKFYAGIIDLLWSEPISTPQCCASDFVPVCKMKVVLAHTGILYLAFDIKVWVLNACYPRKCLSLRGGW